jgi:methylenetetrahydrofolate--tRNA-(uracil-5-)-methyltransferase
MIPGLENAEFLRYGVMHRNTYLNSPELLLPTYAMKNREKIYFAGQMTGVEGYIESTGSGFVAGLNAARQALGIEQIVFPSNTMLGAMAKYISSGSARDFVPMNANFGIIDPLEYRVKGGKKFKYEAIAERALAAVSEVAEKYSLK